MDSATCLSTKLAKIAKSDDTYLPFFWSMMIENVLWWFVSFFIGWTLLHCSILFPWNQGSAALSLYVYTGLSKKNTRLLFLFFQPKYYVTNHGVSISYFGHVSEYVRKISIFALLLYRNSGCSKLRLVFLTWQAIVKLSRFRILGLLRFWSQNTN